MRNNTDYINKQRSNDNTAPFITIAIPSYNYSSYLKRAFEMIKQQEFQDFEILYCDDCSDDDSVEVIKEIITENPDMQIRMIENPENLGILKTKTRLMYESTGKYIMFCDADDYMSEDCLKKLSNVAVKTNADRIVSEVYDIRVLKNGKTKILQKQNIPKITSKWLWNLNHGCLYKREVFISNNIMLDFVPDDVCLTLYFSRHSKKTAWIRRPLYYWCVHDDSAGRKAQPRDKQKLLSEFQNAVIKIDQFYNNMDYDTSQQLELLIIKLYYLNIFHSLRTFSLNEKLETYYELKRILKQYHKNYLENVYIRHPSKMPLRNYAKYIIIACAIVEKVHFMKAFLAGYHLLNNFVYFDQ
ncbi:MAG: glycosyltransferase [Lachnospiraceae bacterium]|nr:glycosyltransferase [Lachnospiraceae bacterium]